MNILFVPNLHGGLSHQIPLYVLYQRYFRRVQGVKSAFLLPSSLHQNFKNKNVRVLDLDYGIPLKEGYRPILKTATSLFDKVEEAINTFRPDIVIEDMDFISGIKCKKYQIPKISITRTGLFRSSNPFLRNPSHCHSIEKNEGIRRFRYKAVQQGQLSLISDFYDEDFYLPQIENTKNTPVNILEAKARIVPGVCSIVSVP